MKNLIVSFALLCSLTAFAGLTPILEDGPQATEHVYQSTVHFDPVTANGDVTNTLGAWQQFLSDATTNLIIAPYGIASTDFKKFGGGLAVGYKLSDNVVPTLRIDYYDGRLWMPSGNLQLQVPFHLGPVTVIPFAFTGVAVPINSGASDPVVGMVGTGGAVRLGKSFDFLADYEIWSSLGNQIRVGIGWKPNGW